MRGRECRRESLGSLSTSILRFAVEQGEGGGLHGDEGVQAAAATQEEIQVRPKMHTQKKVKFHDKVVRASLFGVGAPKALVIGVVALLVFGPKGLAEASSFFEQ
ncbi:hypothetical protein ZIOFF_055314 [Zingiber officinale]|uniref:Uncharacterized protein n=1 Tax=Zingiber officinale TaxID=94328 RepID=A0A8J5FG79_ZINOF|nr:hypothetical protein ZIOFF_055314 [Zingiber officinale]